MISTLILCRLYFHTLWLFIDDALTWGIALTMESNDETNSDFRLDSIRTPGTRSPPKAKSPLHSFQSKLRNVNTHNLDCENWTNFELWNQSLNIILMETRLIVISLFLTGNTIQCTCIFLTRMFKVCFYA